MRDELPYFARYLLAQVPGLTLVAGLLYLAVRADWVGPTGAIGLWLAVLGYELAVYSRVRKALRSPGLVGPEALAGQTAIALTPLTRQAPTGFVRVGSERWRARLAGGDDIAPGSRLRVEGVDGLELAVSSPRAGTLRRGV